MTNKPTSSSRHFLLQTGVLIGVFFCFISCFDEATVQARPPMTSAEKRAVLSTASAPQKSNVPEAILPRSTTGEVVRHTWFTLSYAEKYEQAEWVAYELTRERLNAPWAPRPNTFRPDPDVGTESATPRDYVRSGYDKGHLCPAADMAFSAQAIDETFFMSNISPQDPAFNAGIWRELEEQTRAWAKKYAVLYIATGPVLTPGTTYQQLGTNRVSVPNAFYKVLLAPNDRQAIAFILPNAAVDKPLMDYAFTIDKIERLTGIDFFPKLLKGRDEAIESTLDKNAWPIFNKRRDKHE